MSSLQTKKSKPLIEQATTNTTSWVGRRPDDKELLCGQTFISPAEGVLDSIEVFSSIVSKPGKLVMTLHQFDRHHKTWGPAMGTTSVEMNSSSAGSWVAFPIPGLLLQKGQSYGFKLESADAYVGIGEAAGSYANPPFDDGQEWQFLKNEQRSHAFSYFSLAFKVGLRA
ncbi:MAG: hypothetical protein V4725_12555 [Bacteroidota bacterium]